MRREIGEVLKRVKEEWRHTSGGDNIRCGGGGFFWCFFFFSAESVWSSSRSTPRKSTVAAVWPFASCRRRPPSGPISGSPGRNGDGGRTGKCGGHAGVFPVVPGERSRLPGEMATLVPNLEMAPGNRGGKPNSELTAISSGRFEVPRRPVMGERKLERSRFDAFPPYPLRSCFFLLFLARPTWGVALSYLS